MGPVESEELVPVGARELADRWPMLAARGAVALAFGIFAFLNPGFTLAALVLTWGGWMLVNGGLDIGLGIKRHRLHQHWGWLIFDGVVSIAAGVVTFVWPRITALVLLLVIASWAVVTGVAQIGTAVRLRKQLRGEWLLGLAGVVSILFGGLLFLFPGAGALAVIYWLAAYAVVFGVLLIAAALKLRSWARGQERRLPPGGVPTQA